MPFQFREEAGARSLGLPATSLQFIAVFAFLFCEFGYHPPEQVVDRGVDLDFFWTAEVIEAKRVILSASGMG